VTNAASRCLALTLLLAGGCAHLPDASLPQRGLEAPAEIRIDPETGRHSLELDVLTYNVEGLPWPVRSGRRAALARIGSELGAMRDQGRAPHIVLIQEGFISATGELIAASGYANAVAGPDRRHRAPPSPEISDPKFRTAGRRARGERLGKWLHSGLYLLSDYPIIEHHVWPFRHCAGFDCLANKGVLFARLDIPGLPAPLQVFNLHLNSRRASGEKLRRTNPAHRLQLDELDHFLDRVHRPSEPMVFGGDFNTRRSQERFGYLEARHPFPIVRHYCSVIVDDCEILISFDGDEPWLDTQDLIGFDSSEQVDVRPIRIEAMFDAPANGTTLSDHDGYLVRFRLSWDPSPTSCPAAPSGIASRARGKACE